MAEVTEVAEARRERLQALQDAALEFVNVLRAYDAAPAASRLLPGNAWDCLGCPLARTASDGCDGAWFVGPVTAVRMVPRQSFARGKRFVTPSLVGEFMSAFDRGEFPELVDEGPASEFIGELRLRAAVRA